MVWNQPAARTHCPCAGWSPTAPRARTRARVSSSCAPTSPGTPPRGHKPGGSGAAERTVGGRAVPESAHVDADRPAPAVAVVAAGHARRRRRGEVGWCHWRAVDLAEQGARRVVDDGPALLTTIGQRAVMCFGWVFFLDFVWRSGTTRTEGPHGAYVRRARRNRIDRHGGKIERLATRTAHWSGLSSSSASLASLHALQASSSVDARLALRCVCRHVHAHAHARWAHDAAQVPPVPAARERQTSGARVGACPETREKRPLWWTQWQRR